jgi:hypothetical protein
LIVSGEQDIDRYTRILQYSLDGKLITNSSSLTEAAKNSGFSKHAITTACKSDLRVEGGYLWECEKVQFGPLELNVPILFCLVLLAGYFALFIKLDLRFYKIIHKKCI